MEEKNKKTPKLSDEQTQELLENIMKGDIEEAHELLENVLFKDKRFEEMFSNIAAEKYKEFFTEFNKLNIFERYDYIVAEMFNAKVQRQFIYSILKAYKEDLKVTDDFQDILYRISQEDFETSLDTDISALKEYNKKKIEKKDETE